MTHNATGQDLNAAQEELIGCYARLASVLNERRHELAPFEERNALKALAALWQVANGLDMEPGHIYDLGA